ncbi:helix-turn-helix domain-containing protein [Streptomyces sp. AC555_RSS877]|uniref:nSTAND1 domain-containing NTPase n=1 Tax=Streptomyces sp. AC555_RSS877 TaxID=2823688 RepID=UPI001C26B780|nr:helix-turn-helix domain-containing protein [Streptomyces sp. AC555_RSS877]
MGRRESPLDPEAGPVQRFAHQLRTLRQESGGTTYRAMADRVEYSAATLSEAAAGERLPSLPVVLAYVQACGGDAQEWERRWRQAAQEEAAQPPGDDGAVAPYRGLARFEPGDRDRFFGRDRLVADLAGLAREHRFAALVGTSGSGKSSLLRAGLIPALQNETSPTARPAAIRILTPGENPTAHADTLIPLDGDADTWVMIDQFEEIFTLCQDPDQRTQFIDLLLTALQPDSHLRVVIAVRADFYGHCVEHRYLADALRTANLLVAPMTPEELREAIVKPAAADGLTLERALTSRVVADVVDEPGGLPLMSHVLLETWRRRRGKTLTLKGYEAAGGVHGAIAHTAEHLYTQLSPEQAALTRRLLLRLIVPGEGAHDTRRPAQRTELATCGPASADIALVLDHLARARLVTLDDDTVDLAHEALITSWPRLHTWIERDRELLRQHRRLTEAATTWDQLNRDPGALYRGTQLALAKETFTPERQDHLTPVEQSFLTASLDTRRHEQRTAARTTRRLRTLASALAVLLVMAITAAGLALDQRQTAVTAQQEAVTAQRQALSRQLAAQSTALLDSNTDLASLLAIQAYRISPTREATTSLYAAAALPLQHRLTGHTGGVRSVAFSPDGRTLTTSSSDAARVWDAATARTKATLNKFIGSPASVGFRFDGRALVAGGNRTVRVRDVGTGRILATLRHIHVVESVAFSPDGRTLATGGGDGTARLWDIATGSTKATLNNIVSVTSLAFSPDGRTLATGSDEGTARLWDIATGSTKATLNGHTNGVTSVAFSSDGSTLATGSGHGLVRLWDPVSGRTQATFTSNTKSVTSLAFSPDGRTLATGGDDGTARLWNATRSRATLTGHPNVVTSVAFSPDGRTLATSSERAVRLWDVATRRAKAILNSIGSVTSMAFSPNGRTLATGSDDDSSSDGRAQLWNQATGRSQATLISPQHDVGSVVFSPNGDTLATGSSDGTVHLWNLATRRNRATFDGHGSVTSLAISPDGTILAVGGYGETDPNHQITRVTRLRDLSTGRTFATLNGHTGGIMAFSPDGETIATGGSDGTARLWDVPTGRAKATLTGHTSSVTSVAFSPDGRTLATGSHDGNVRLWDTATGYTRAILTEFGGVTSIAFSPDGRTLATGSDDGDVQLWDATLPDPAGTISEICKAVNRDLTRQERSVYLPSQTLSPVCTT